MARPVVGIYASVAPVSWGPWIDRPSLLAPAALGEAARRAGAMVVLIPPDPALERVELLATLDALVVLEAVPELEGLRAAAREHGVAIVVLDPDRMLPSSAPEGLEHELRALLAKR